MPVPSIQGSARRIDQFYFTNSPFVDELIFFHRASRTVIIADLSQTFSEAFLKRHWPWWMRSVARLSKMVEGRGYPPIDYRISFRHRASARPKIRELIAKHPEHVVVAHGEVVRTAGETFLRCAFSWLLQGR
jgi:broad specificity phosphatase PhoE